MSEIDWSKAPEGATHYYPEDDETFEHWMKVNGDHREVWLPGRGSWQEDGDRDDPPLNSYVPRPSAWNGEGLPPVGTVCEWLDRNCKRWLPVEIMFCSSWVVVVRDTKSHPDGPVDLAIELIGEEPEFRPLRTLEQIKDEEKKAAIMALLEEVPGLAVVNARKIIDAGYRKVEGGAA